MRKNLLEGMKIIWLSLVAMVVCGVGMMLSFGLFILTFMDVFRYIGFGFMVGATAVLIVTVIKLRKMFKGESGFGEKTWRSYDFRKKP